MQVFCDLFGYLPHMYVLGDMRAELGEDAFVVSEGLRKEMMRVHDVYRQEERQK